MNKQIYTNITCVLFDNSFSFCTSIYLYKISTTSSLKWHCYIIPNTYMNFYLPFKHKQNIKVDSDHIAKNCQ